MAPMVLKPPPRRACKEYAFERVLHVAADLLVVDHSEAAVRRRARYPQGIDTPRSERTPRNTPTPLDGGRLGRGVEQAAPAIVGRCAQWVLR